MTGRLDAEGIRAAMRSLDKAVGDGNKIQVLELLDRLRSDVEPSESLLRETKLGITIGKLRTNADARIAGAAKDLVKEWRGRMGKESSKADKDPKGPPEATAKSERTSGKDEKEAKKPEVPAQVRDAKSDGVDTEVTGHRIRDSCITLLYNALAWDSGIDGATLLKRAKQIDEVVLKQSKSLVDQTYRTKMRSLYLNLKDKNNPMLRSSVGSGDISAERLCSMTPQEMASAERREADMRIAEENLFNARGAKPVKAVTDLFQCGKCKQRKVSYYQMQTRSADEPMTTFCECMHCGNRWKFS